MKNLSGLQKYLSFRSVSTAVRFKPECRRTAVWLAEYLRRLGAETEVMATPGNPVVFGMLGKDPGKKTVLLYGHYDVQPTEPEREWTKDPWRGEIAEGRIWGRGTSDNKGQFWAHILAIRDWQRKKKELPVNLKLVVEGEEEIGSPNMEKFIQENAALLAADLVWIADGSATAEGAPTIDAGLRGSLNAQLMVMGPNRDLHSGSYGGALDNPINALSAVLASLAGPAGVVKVPGFYQAVKPISRIAKKILRAESFDEEAFLRDAGSPALAGEEEYNVPERIGLRPTMQVTGISGGYEGEGFKNIVPKQAMAKLNFRLARGQDWRRVEKRVKAYVAQIMPEEVRWEWRLDTGNNAYAANLDSSNIQKAREVFGRVFGKETAVRFEGGSLPVANWFAENVSPEVLLSGWAGEMHGVDESLSLAMLEKGVRANQEFWVAIS